ncbi:MAG: transposase [Actinomycetota bacterium]|nr:transposase [Actinomycetota bacterium]
MIRKLGIAPAAICSIQTFGDMLGYNPHLHILCADGGFGDSGIFYAISLIAFNNLEIDRSSL